MNILHRCLIVGFVLFWSVWTFNNVNPWLGLGMTGAYVYYVIRTELKDAKNEE